MEPSLGKEPRADLSFSLVPSTITAMQFAKTAPLTSFSRVFIFLKLNSSSASSLGRQWKEDSSMPDRCRFLALLCSLVFGICSCGQSSRANLYCSHHASVHGDVGDSDDDSDDELVSSLFISLCFDEASHVSVNASLFASKGKQPGHGSIVAQPIVTSNHNA
jgi:hypothetical protein